jgi:hypothetical protein
MVFGPPKALRSTRTGMCWGGRNGLPAERGRQSVSPPPFAGSVSYGMSDKGC